jgi:hypothetical protein
MLRYLALDDQKSSINWKMTKIPIKWLKEWNIGVLCVWVCVYNCLFTIKISEEIIFNNL